MKNNLFTSKFLKIVLLFILLTDKVLNTNQTSRSKIDYKDLSFTYDIFKSFDFKGSRIIFDGNGLDMDNYDRFKSNNFEKNDADLKIKNNLENKVKIYKETVPQFTIISSFWHQFKELNFLNYIMSNQAKYLKVFSKILFIVMVIVLYN